MIVCFVDWMLFVLLVLIMFVFEWLLCDLLLFTCIVFDSFDLVFWVALAWFGPGQYAVFLGLVDYLLFWFWVLFEYLIWWFDYGLVFACVAFRVCWVFMWLGLLFGF